MLKPEQEAHRNAVSARFARHRARWDAYKVANILWRRHLARECQRLTGKLFDSSDMREGLVVDGYMLVKFNQTLVWKKAETTQ